MNGTSSLKIILYIGGAAFLIVYIGSLVRIIIYERRINKLTDELNEKAEFERGQPQSQTTVDGRIDRHRMIYEPKIADLKRKRKFILEKLPFIRK